MKQYVLRRVALAIPTLFIVSLIVFSMMRLMPGGPFDKDKKLPPEILANIEAKYHLDKPLYQQYLLYIRQILKGDLGPSYKYLGRDAGWEGILKHGVYHIHKKIGVDESVMWGEYFFVEALSKALRDAEQ